MKRCLGGRLTPRVHENGRTFQLRPRITFDVWKTMLECQVNLRQMQLWQCNNTQKKLHRSAHFFGQELALFGQEMMEASVVGLVMVNNTLPRSCKKL